MSCGPVSFNLLCASFAACVLLSFGKCANAQDAGQRTVRCNDPAQLVDPVLISNVAVAGTTVQCGLFIKPPAVVQPITAFQAGGDWLQQMTISMINRTAQVIDYATLGLMFLDNADDCRQQVCPLEQIRLGQIPKADAFNGRGTPLRAADVGASPLDWKPGQTITVHVADFIGEIETKLQNFESASSVRQVAIHVGPFCFRDGIRWTGSRYSKPDPQNPGKFIALPADFFPGRRNSNWPPGYTQ